MPLACLQNRIVFDNYNAIPSEWIAFVKMIQTDNVWKIVGVSSRGSKYMKTFIVEDSIEKRNLAAKWYQNLRAIVAQSELPFPDVEMN